MRMMVHPSAAAIARLASRDASRDPAVERSARRIVDDVRTRGDVALREWRWRLDRDASPLVVTASDMETGWDATPRNVRAAIRLAIRHAKRVAQAQRPQSLTVRPVPGIRIDQRVEPLARVGCYVPAGRYPLPSTLVMTVVPAKAAGVTDVTVVCPKPAPVVLCAALEAGATRVLRVGGAQAIGALAYGTRTIARVDKIVGPGNAWVAAAKAYVSADCAIDMHAGPSEIVVWSERGKAPWIAADLIAQAEHDPDARAIFVTTDRRLADRVVRMVATMVRPGHAAYASLARRGAVIVAADKREALAIVNAIAPEHLVCDKVVDAEHAIAGTIFVGPWSAQAAGDYATGSNHVLPTGGAARFRGGLSAGDFVRVCSMQTLSVRGLATIAPSVIALAEAEGLRAHANSVRTRLT